MSFRALFWSVPLSPLEQNCFLLAAQPQMQAEETRRSTMCCRSRSDSARAHSFFYFFYFGSSPASFIRVNCTFFSSAARPHPYIFLPYLSPLTASTVHLMASSSGAAVLLSAPGIKHRLCVQRETGLTCLLHRLLVPGGGKQKPACFVLGLGSSNQRGLPTDFGAYK